MFCASLLSFTPNASHIYYTNKKHDQIKNQILITLDVLPIKVYRVGGAHRHNLGQGTQCKIASVANRWQLVLD